MFAKLRLATILSVGAAALSLGSVAQAQTVTDVTVKDGAGNTIAENVRSFDENEAGSGLAVGFTPVIGSTFSFLYQANVVSFNDASGNTIVPTAGLNQSFSAGGYEFTIWGEGKRFGVVTLTLYSGFLYSATSNDPSALPSSVSASIR